MKLFEYLIIPIKRTFNYQDRARRSEFWEFAIWTGLIYGLMSYGAMKLESDLQRVITSPLFIAAYVVLFLLYLPLLSVSVRRLHDIGKSGWWLFISLIPFIGALLLAYWLFKNGDVAANKYGDNPKNDGHASDAKENKSRFGLHLLLIGLYLVVTSAYFYELYRSMQNVGKNVSKDDPVIEKTVSLDPKETEGEKIQLKVYEFNICGNKTIKNPTYEIISQAFNDVLNGVCGDDSFLILSVANIDGTYVQMALLPDRETIQLEYQDGAEDKHFESTGNPSSSEAIIAFVKYSQGSKTWDDGFSWRRIKI